MKEKTKEYKLNYPIVSIFYFYKKGLKHDLN